MRAVGEHSVVHTISPETNLLEHLHYWRAARGSARWWLMLRRQPPRAAPPPGTYLPLARVALCLDCETCFDIGAAGCPACGSGTLAAIGRFLVGTSPKGGPAAADRHDPQSDTHVGKRIVFVVSRDERKRKLYEQLKRAFAGDAGVQVVLDRRVRERRAQSGRPTVEHRQRDRRTRRRVDDRVQTVGLALVWLGAAGPDSNARLVRRGEAEADR